MTLPQRPFSVSALGAVVAVTAALGIIFDVAFYDRQPGLSFPLFVAAILGGLVVLTGVVLRVRLNPSVRWLSLPLLGFASMVAVRDSAFLTLLNIGACILLLLLITDVSVRRQLTQLTIKDYLRLPLRPIAFIQPAVSLLGRLVSARRTVTGRPITGQVIRGVLLALPVLIVFSVLFASADAVIARYLSSVVSFNIDDELVARTIIIVAVTIGLIGAYAYALVEPAPEAALDRPERPRRLGQIESNILFGSVNVLFGLFILVQLVYLFGGSANLSELGLTYAEYARKGFFELLAVAVVAFALVKTAERHVIRTDSGHSLGFKLMTSVLIAQVLVIMGSAFRRLYLYEQAFGFTTLRLYSHAFTVLLAVVFVILLVKIIRSASDQAFALPVLLAVMAGLAGLNLLNPDEFIARQNLERYRQTGKLDATYLRRLSSDAVPLLVRELPALKADDSRRLGSYLYLKRLDRQRNPDNGWQSWNASRAAADRALVGAAGLLEPYAGGRYQSDSR